MPGALRVIAVAAELPRGVLRRWVWGPVCPGVIHLGCGVPNKKDESLALTAVRAVIQGRNLAQGRRWARQLVASH